MNVAIIGMGPMGLRHVASVARVEGLRLTSVVDTRPEALQHPSIPAEARHFSSAEILFKQAPTDLVIIATTAPSHYALAFQALDAGTRGILCEKPLAVSLAQARAIADAAVSRGVRLAVNHGRRFVPAYRWLAGKIQSGDWGELRSMRFSCPGIGLGCLATHFVDLMRFLSGHDFVSLSGWVDPTRGANPRGSQFQDPGGMIAAVDDVGARYIHEQIEDGAGPMSGVIDLTGARVIVDERECRLDVLVRDHSVRPGPGRPAVYAPIQPPELAPLRLDIVEMGAQALRELMSDGPLSCAAEHGYKSLEAVVAAYQSNECGHMSVRLPLDQSEIMAREFPIT